MEEGHLYLGEPTKRFSRKQILEAQDENLPEEKSVVCPVCEKPMSEKYLPDKKGFIDERLYVDGEFRVVAGTVLECDFYHFYDEQANRTLEEPHELTATVKVAFDTSGECTAFDIVEIRPRTRIDNDKR